MGAGHAHPLYVHEHSPIHRLVPETKIVAAFGMVVCIALTPREAVWAFGLYALLLLTLDLVARIPLRFVVLRLVAVAPFVLFALFLPFLGTGDTTRILGVQVSIDGVWSAWNIIAKAALGASVSIVLTATTEVTELIRGLGILRVPVLFTSIATFMIRYMELLSDELGRMRVAMTARGYDPRWLAQARPIATSAGALFVRSYERGERIHDAMLSRGFTGEMPVFERRRATSAEWLAVSAVVVGFLAICVTALVMT
jgi:cobalt/nickel transport system permease protein